MLLDAFETQHEFCVVTEVLNNFLKYYFKVCLRRII